VPATVMLVPGSEPRVAIADFAIRLPDAELSGARSRQVERRQPCTNKRKRLKSFQTSQFSYCTMVMKP
jgi:hypothetical protein